MSCSLTNPYFHHPSFILAVVSEALKSLFMTLGLPTVSAAHGMEVRARWYHNLISTKYNFPLEVVSGYCHNWCMMMMAATMKMKKTKIMWLLTNGNPGWYYGVARPDWGPEEISHPGFQRQISWQDFVFRNNYFNQISFLKEQICFCTPLAALYLPVASHTLTTTSRV